jgi:hypothetical protein
MTAGGFTVTKLKPHADNSGSPAHQPAIAAAAIVIAAQPAA